MEESKPCEEKKPCNEMRSAIMAHPSMVGMSWDDIKKGLDRVMPLLETATKLTENPYDDLAVDFIKKLIAQQY